MSKPKPSRHAPDEIDAYFATLPEDARSALERVRTIIHATAPGCTERVSYGIPMFRLQKDLVGLSAQATHCSLHTTSPALMETMADELKRREIKVSGATIHFTPESPLPEDLIESILGARVNEIGGK